jgi:hypothetical protein
VGPADIPTLEQEIAASPEDTDLQVQLGMAQFEAGEHDAARTTLQAAVDAGNEPGSAFLYLGMANEGAECAPRCPAGTRGPPGPRSVRRVGGGALGRPSWPPRNGGGFVFRPHVDFKLQSREDAGASDEGSGWLVAAGGDLPVRIFGSYDFFPKARVILGSIKASTGEGVGVLGMELTGTVRASF